MADCAGAELVGLLGCVGGSGEVSGDCGGREVLDLFDGDGGGGGGGDACPGNLVDERNGEPGGGAGGGAGGGSATPGLVSELRIGTGFVLVPWGRGPKPEGGLVCCCSRVGAGGFVWLSGVFVCAAWKILGIAGP